QPEDCFQAEDAVDAEQENSLVLGGFSAHFGDVEQQVAEFSRSRSGSWARREHGLSGGSVAAVSRSCRRSSRQSFSNRSAMVSAALVMRSRCSTVSGPARDAR